MKINRHWKKKKKRIESIGDLIYTFLEGFPANGYLKIKDIQICLEKVNI